MELSFWERESLLQFDVIIVGSGIVGLSTACSLLEKKADLRVAVLERGLLPTGASTRNAGFACFGSVTELLEDLKTSSEKEVKDLVKARYEGLLKLRKRLGDEAIGLENNGGYELVLEDIEMLDEKIDKLNKLLLPVFGENTFSLKDEQINEFGFEGVKHLIYTPFESSIDTGKMMLSLQKKATSLGAVIITGCEVTSFKEKETTVSVSVFDSFRKSDLTLSADKLILCTNAFTKTLLSELDINPGRGIVIITKPIEGLKLKGNFHFNQGYFYFRNVGNRILFGGGRNLFFNEEATMDFTINSKIMAVLHSYLEEIILPNQPYRIDMEWTGIMAFGETKNPIIKQISERIICGVRMGGMGVALGTETGERIAELAL